MALETLVKLVFQERLSLYIVEGESLEEWPSIWVEIFKKATFCIVIQARIDFPVSHMPKSQPTIL